MQMSFHIAFMWLVRMGGRRGVRLCTSCGVFTSAPLFSKDGGGGGGGEAVYLLWGVYIGSALQ